MATRGIPVSRYTYTAPGDLGVHRRKMLGNHTLLRDKLGQVKTTVYDLPDKSFTYGRANEKRTFTAADALRWKIAPKPVYKRWMDRDYKALNHAALSTGLVTAEENYDFRATHDIRLKPPTDNLPLNLPPGMVFGMPSRPSTPMWDILEHKYQDNWIMNRMNIELKRRQRKKLNEEDSGYSSASSFAKKKLPEGQHYDTKATLLRTYQNPVDEGPLWQMPRFTKSAKPHLQTFRSSKAKEEAFKNYDLDHISRKGINGTGVYEAAKN